MLASGKHKEETLAIVREILNDIRDLPFDAALEFWLNRFGPYSGTFEALARVLKLGVDEGWVAYAPIEGAGYNRGRLAEPTHETAGMSVETALLRAVRGQYHCHIRGEIDMVVPLDSSARFCGHAAGWVVYPPRSEHWPTFTGGGALIMFFLPNGENEYKAPAWVQSAAPSVRSPLVSLDRIGEKPVTHVTILALCGSSRRGSLNQKLLTLAAAGAQGAGARVSTPDLRQLHLPIYDGDLESDQGLPDGAHKFKTLMTEHNALLIASPEHNGGSRPCSRMRSMGQPSDRAGSLRTQRLRRQGRRRDLSVHRGN